MSSPKVMIVDDNPYNVELASFVLSSDGVEVAVAVNAADALAQIPVFRPDLILMDVQMPGMDGLELTRRLKADAATGHVRIVAFTAYAMKGDEAKMLAAGCDAYLTKPIEVATFARQVRACLAPAG